MNQSHFVVVLLSGVTVMALALCAMTLPMALGSLRQRLERLLTWTQRERYQRWLRQAGLPHWVVADLLLLRVAASGLAWLLAFWLMGTVLIGFAFAACAWLGVLLWLKSRAAHYQQQLTAELPAFLDLLCLCLGSGMNLQTAVALVIELYGSGGVGCNRFNTRHGLLMHWRRWLSCVCAGSSRLKAFEQLMSEVGAPAVRRVCVAMIQAERAGAGMTHSLMRQADQLRHDRLLAIERKAMQAPVKMLMPLVICFFPSTFLVLGFSMWVSLADTLQGLG